uniref:COMM domain containing 10 n=1 Tax=Bos mutus grunniens TaxID=30521 RepID=A0A8B9XJ54_BOSMU
YVYSLNSELREWRGVGLLRKPLRPSRTAGAERRGPGEAWPFRLAVRRRLRHWLGSRHLTRAAGPGSFKDGGVRGADSAGEPQAESSFSEEEEEKLQVAFSLEKQDLHLVLETISFILEQAVYHNVKPAALQQQLESIHLRQDKAEAFASAWSSMGQETIEKFRQRILAPHKLETVGWQLNLQMAHSAEAKLKSPQAVLQLGVSSEDSKSLQKVLVEFSHKELFDFYNKLETIQAQLDSLT